MTTIVRIKDKDGNTLAAVDLYNVSGVKKTLGFTHYYVKVYRDDLKEWIEVLMTLDSTVVDKAVETITESMERYENER